MQLSARIPRRYVAAPSSLLLLAACVTAFGCAHPQSKSPTSGPQLLQIKGSDTMRILAQRWAEQYMRQHSGTSIYVEGGGSRRGIDALIAGKADLCAASRPLTADEVRKLHQRHGSLGFKFLTAKDALSIYLNPANPVLNLTLSQLADILTGKIKQWSEVGGRPERIEVLIREPSSGTRAFLQEHVMGGETYSPDAVTVAGTEALARRVAENPAAIGFGGLAYGPQVYHCRINNVPPTEETVRDGSYPIARYLYLYTVDEPTGPVRDFINWVLSDEGQKIVRDTGYVTLWNLPADETP
jgi:phosphate transport system substrate-binding protein